MNEPKPETAVGSTGLIVCPHCGEANVKVEWEPSMTLGEDDTSRNWFVECQKCGAQGPCSNREDRARQYWNQRRANPESSSTAFLRLLDTWHKAENHWRKVANGEGRQFEDGLAQGFYRCHVMLSNLLWQGHGLGSGHLELVVDAALAVLSRTIEDVPEHICEDVYLAHKILATRDPDGIQRAGESVTDINIKPN